MTHKEALAEWQRRFDNVKRCRRAGSFQSFLDTWGMMLELQALRPDLWEQKKKGEGT